MYKEAEEKFSYE